MMQKNTFLFLLILISEFSGAQRFALVIKNGHILDPKNHINDTMDIGVKDGRIAVLQKNIDASQALCVVDAKGCYVVPGLIDIHTHAFHGTQNGLNYCDGKGSLMPDVFTFQSGITTIADAGSSGWRNFEVFKEQVIDRSQTRVFAFLNIVGNGMRGGRFEQDTTDMDAELTARVAKKYASLIVGLKVAHYELPDWRAIDEAVKAGNEAALPVMIDFGESTPHLSIEELFSKHLRGGDIFTHCFAQVKSREPVVDLNTKRLKSYVMAAQKKGIAFDVGYGRISFDFSEAIPAIQSGFYPNSISTDMQNANGPDSVKSILNIMSKFLALGIKFSEVVAECTSNPAKEIRHEELGQIAPGGVADLTILHLRNGQFTFFDCKHQEIKGTQNLECMMTIKDGKIMYTNSSLNK